MATQIIDGFQVNVALPIDNRIVASGSTARNAIPYKYEGLRVFDLSNGIPYVWLNGTWVSENASSVAGSGTTSYIPLYTSSNTISNSILYKSGNSIRTENVGAGDGLIDINALNGSITAQQFIGDGYYLNNLRGDNINIGSIPISRLNNGSPGWLLSGALGQPVYINPTQITVGTASVANSATNVNVANSTANSTHYITFASTNGTTGVKVNVNGLSYNPFTNLLKTNGGDVQFSSSVNSVGYVIRGTRNFSANGLGSLSTQYTIGTVTVPSNCTITIEATFTGYVRQYSGLILAGSHDRSTKLVAAYVVGSGGSFTQMGSNSSPFSFSSSPTGNVTMDPGVINTSTANTITFIQNVTTFTKSSISLTVDFKISIA